MHAAAQKSADRQNDGGGMKGNAACGDNPVDLLTRDDEIGDFLLKQGQAGLVFQPMSHGLFIQLTVSLGAGRAYRRAFACI